jgi:hypothetical protein
MSEERVTSGEEVVEREQPLSLEDLDKVAAADGSSSTCGGSPYQQVVLGLRKSGGG